jgi:transitional endoplasmic reticulum ATPase
MATEVTLTQCQRAAAGALIGAIPTTSVLMLRSDSGKGRTTILRQVQAEVSGSLVSIKNFLDVLKARDPLAIEESLTELVDGRFEQDDLVIIDDFQLIRNVVDSFEYPRRGLLDAMLTALLDRADRDGKRILFGTDLDGGLPSIGARARVWTVGDFAAADYETICRQYFCAPVADRLDYSQIHRFAPMLNTDKFVDYLGENNLISNVKIEEVRVVALEDIKGVDDVIDALEAKIALPFENPVLAAELDLKPRRGVLLAGPPGTGKTTIGRALARRLKGKFFLLDGTAISGTEGFYSTIDRVFNAARRNAPAVIFIDDADVIFENGGDRGLYRYLLTKLDGLESASAERVCVMLTAMDPGNLPQALLRSGRIELWLETRLPDIDARVAIFRESLAKLPPPISEVDFAVLAAASQGLTGADLRSVIEDGKLVFARDKSNGTAYRPAEEYFLEAIGAVRENRRNYAKRRPALFKDVVKIGFDARD